MFDAMSERLRPPDDEFGMLIAMSECLDLRKIIVDSTYYSAAKAQRGLRTLYDWMQTRFDAFVPPPDVRFPAMPAFDGANGIWAQYERFAKNLNAAFNAERSPFRHWKDASGTVIMADIWSDSAAAKLAKLAADCHDFLYLFLHMASKSMCESVVESMGGMWDLCSSASRQQHRKPSSAGVHLGHGTQRQKSSSTML